MGRSVTACLHSAGQCLHVASAYTWPILWRDGIWLDSNVLTRGAKWRIFGGKSIESTHPSFHVAKIWRESCLSTMYTWSTHIHTLNEVGDGAPRSSRQCHAGSCHAHCNTLHHSIQFNPNPIQRLRPHSPPSSSLIIQLGLSTSSYCNNGGHVRPEICHRRRCCCR